MIGLAGRTKTKILGDNFIITINYLIMKMKKFIWGICACMALCACSDEGKDVTDVDNGNTVIFPNGEAYINVRISEAGALTRATTKDDSTGFEFADENTKEGKVENAKFYFYDATGAFVLKNDVWDGGNIHAPNPDNIEFDGKTVVVLRGLTETNFPNYMLTVLNAPANFEAGATLEEAQKNLMALNNGVEGVYKNGENFVMSTTSYVREDGTPYYCVTTLSPENFAKSTEQLKDAQIVKVYVERLAAKVALRTTLTEASSYMKGDDKVSLYKLNVSIAGEENDEGKVVFPGVGEDATDDEIKAGATDIYVEFVGWGLNATAKDSYLLKGIKTAWQNTNPADKNTYVGFEWDANSYFRSYWGTSFAYGHEISANSAADVATEEKDKDGNTVFHNSDNSTYLNFISAENCNGVINKDVAYCAENTNTADYTVSRAARTSVILVARICDKDGNDLEDDLVRFNGLLYLKKSYLNYVLNTQKINLYYKVAGVDEDATDDKKYKQINNTYVELVNMGDGKVKVALTKDTEDAITTLYKKVESAMVPAETTDIDIVNTALSFKNFESQSPAIGYKGGLMYYNIPIEHLNNETETIEGAKVKTFEANYGVVRNHYYQLTVNKLENLGKGVYDPDEVIVPNEDDEKENYYVGATINILSWKVVSQNVGL